MMSKLRWSLLILGVLFIVVREFWEWRRPHQAQRSLGRSSAAREPPPETPTRALREPPLVLPELRARAPLAREPLAAHELPLIELEPRAAPMPVASPTGTTPAEDAIDGERAIDAGDVIDTGVGTDAGRVPAADLPAADTAGAAPTVSADPSTDGEAIAAGASAAHVPEAEASADAVPAAEATRAAALSAPRARLVLESLPELPAAPLPRVEWPPDEARRILALRLVAPLPGRFAGRSLRQALAAEGFVLGQFDIFHKPDEEQRSVLSAASLTRPGTFDMQTMDSQHYGGLSLFAVLPGPQSPPQAFEQLVFTARSLNERLHGVLQDEQGSPLTPARLALLREQLHRTAS